MKLARCRFSTALLLVAVFYDAGTAKPARGYHELPAAVGFPRVPPVVMAAKGDERLEVKPLLFQGGD